MPVRLDTRSADFELRFTAFLQGKREASSDVSAAVAAILAAVQARGDAAVIEYTRRFDRVSVSDLKTLKVSEAEILEAEAACNLDLLAALDLAARRIADFHAHQFPQDLHYIDPLGVELGLRWQPVTAAGLYVPGGLASYPSSVLMNALPAKVAGVERIVMLVPAPDGKLNPAVLAAAKRAGVTEIYKIGGAQAIAALAYGTESIAPVDKIVGPGNAYVAAAKRAVFGQVGIDSIAGPSEILVVADTQNSPDWIALDLLSQAEHDPSAQSILMTQDAAFAEAVATAVNARLERLARAEIAAASWRDHGAILLVETLDAALPLIDRIAPEHLLLAIDAPQRFAAQIRNAGAIFLGRHTPEAVGDYIAGPNHVLPTARSARFSSGLSVFDFMKRTSLVGCNPGALATLAPSIQSLAAAEGLSAHGLSVAVRLGEISP